MQHIRKQGDDARILFARIRGRLGRFCDCEVSTTPSGVVDTVKLTQKTVQSLTGSDSSEVAEIQPLEANIKCEWTDRFLEKIKDGFRIWLRCKVLKSSILIAMPKSETKNAVEVVINKHVEGTLVLTTIPQADRIIVVGSGGERVIEPVSNVVSIAITNLDQKVEVSNAGYKKTMFELPKDFLHGSKIQKDVVLQRN
ncbi:MAG: hypothetical protein JNM39_01370 [Bdellovibrionaceae bacterium]|nr:hypothetical protein [Pseudobdellovibrionaceae bacterium]